MFLEYWRNADATRDKFAGDYLLTGDTGTIDADGFVRFVGRDDDVITSAGYRIGPARSRTACSRIRRCGWRPSSACPTRRAPRSSRRSWC